MRGISRVLREKSGTTLVVQIISQNLNLKPFVSNLFAGSFKIKNYFTGNGVCQKINFLGPATNLKLKGIIRFFEGWRKLVKGCLLEMCQEIGLNSRGANKWLRFPLQNCPDFTNL